MKRILLLLLLFFTAISFSQEEEVLIHDTYLSELLSTDEEELIYAYDIENISGRKQLIDEITSYSYIDPSFLKTSMLLSMLKYKIGTESFSIAYNHYITQISHDHSKISASGFIKVMEETSDQDLTEFYNDWFLGKGYPSYDVSWFQNEENRISITVKQTQSDPSVDFFEMPLPIEVKSDEGDSQIIRLEISENNQGFNGYIPFKITSVTIDPEHQLISKNNSVTTGVDQEVLNTNISLYPNPAKNFLNIQNYSEAEIEKISIFNMLGKLVMIEQMPSPGRAIDLKPLNFGLHLVKIETSQGTVHKTILKEQ